MITTVVGHYPKIPNRPRPARLRNAIAQFDRSEITREQLGQVADEVTIEVIAEQTEAGLDLVTDGAIRWQDEITYFASGLSGVEITGLMRFFDTNTFYREPLVTADPAWSSPILVRDWEFARDHSPRPVKAIITGPYTLARHSRDRRPSASLESLAMAYAAAVNHELLALQAAEAPILQVNEPSITWHKEDIGLFARVINRSLEGLTAETALYTYFGDAGGILDELLALPVTTLGLDFVMGPANYDALAGVRFDKKLGFGFIDARNTLLETVDQIAAGVRRVATNVPVERIVISPNMGLEYLPRETAQAKLARMVEGVRAFQGVHA